ncbi:MAG: TonB-dependent receptor, partial [Bacteroidales bacterium]|nr:TonB-dependent receptor [Bacteroidales bacterium]
SQNLNLKAAYTHSFTRPEPDDVVPHRTEKEDKIDWGNPNLIYPLAKNTDLFVEYFGTNNTVLRGGFFYKRIDDFIFSLEAKAEDDTIKLGIPANGNNQPRVKKAENGNVATIMGPKY